MEKTCKNCGTPITKEYCEDNYPEVCEHWTPKKPKTNADRIRAMSDEELADMLYETDSRIGNADLDEWLEWLKQPAEMRGEEDG